MTDFYAFNKWLWGCDPKLAYQIEKYHDQWCRMLSNHHQNTAALMKGDCIIDSRYRISQEDYGMALYSLMEYPDGILPRPMAIYRSTGEMFADLIAHSIRRTHHLNSACFADEVTRLARVCTQTWAVHTGT